MAVLEVKKAGDIILKKICHPVGRVDKRLKQLLNDMAETMYKSNGVGLAAPQVGVLSRVVVIDVGDGLIEMINPVITAHDGLKADTEGCLSLPEIFGEVERYERVTVEFMNRRGKTQQMTGTDLLAVAIQHELDHLDGILFIDRAKSVYRGNSK